MCTDPIHLLQFFFEPWALSGKCLDQFSGLVQVSNYKFLDYLKYFLITLFFEAPVYFLILPKMISFRQRWLLIFIVNLLTHPIVFFGFTYLASVLQLKYADYLLYAEAFAILVEGLSIWKIWRVQFHRAFIASFVANIGSWVLGIYILY